MREHFLLDTGPLQELLVLRFQAESGRKWPDATFQPQALLTRLDREDFPKFVEANRGYLGTSSGVVTETYGFLQRAEKKLPTEARADFRQRFWRLVCATFRDLGMAERTMPVVEMAQHVLVDYGPTDTGLLALAMHSVKEISRVVVLTADGRLRELCLRHEIQAEFVSDRLQKFRTEG